MNALSKHFASKNSPDNTIRRIEALELAVSDLNKKGAGIEADRDMLEKLRKRVEALETESKDQKQHITKAEEDIEALKRMIQAMSSIGKGGDTSNIDTN